MIFVKVVLLVAFFVVESLVLMRIGFGLDSNLPNALALVFVVFLEALSLNTFYIFVSTILPTEKRY